MSRSFPDSEKATENRPLKDIISLVLEDFVGKNNETSQLLIQITESGYFEESQTQSSLTSLSEQLLRTLNLRESENED